MPPLNPEGTCHHTIGRKNIRNHKISPSHVSLFSLPLQRESLHIFTVETCNNLGQQNKDNQENRGQNALKKKGNDKRLKAHKRFKKAEWFQSEGILSFSPFLHLPWDEVLSLAKWSPWKNQTHTREPYFSSAWPYQFFSSMWLRPPRQKIHQKHPMGRVSKFWISASLC